MGKWEGGKVMMSGDMSGNLGYKCDVTNVHHPLTPPLHETCTTPLYIYIDAEYKRASHSAIDSVGGTCIALYLLVEPCFPHRNHHDKNANVRASTRHNRAYDHSPSGPRHEAFGSDAWFGPLAPFMALRGRQSVGSNYPSCGRYHQVRYRP